MSEVSTTTEQLTEENRQVSNSPGNKFYQIRFRKENQIHSACSKIHNLSDEELVMVQTEHGPEPAMICGIGAELPIDDFDKPPALYSIVRRASRDEINKFESLIEREVEALSFCNANIEKLGLTMKLIRVERYFNGSKIIFYFTAENRVDFRALVKDLVQEFRTRVEMRQIGVRHETQMLGGLGCCGRELCCASFMTKFVPVSIKMAKEQNLPLNPSKISGACNRLLCCLTHEFETYKSLKKDMPKPGNIIKYEGQKYKVTQISIMKNTVSVVSLDESNESKVLLSEEWKQAEVLSSKSFKQNDGEDAKNKEQNKPNQPSKKKQQQAKSPSKNKQQQKKQPEARGKNLQQNQQGKSQEKNKEQPPQTESQNKKKPQGKNKKKRYQKKGKKNPA